MPVEERVSVMEEEMPDDRQVAEVEVRGDEAVVRIDSPLGMEERKVKLPRTTWG